MFLLHQKPAEWNHQFSQLSQCLPKQEDVYLADRARAGLQRTVKGMLQLPRAIPRPIRQPTFSTQQ